MVATFLGCAVYYIWIMFDHITKTLSGKYAFISKSLPIENILSKCPSLKSYDYILYSMFFYFSLTMEWSQESAQYETVMLL